jgi:hypothetical protein
VGGCLEEDDVVKLRYLPAYILVKLSWISIQTCQVGWLRNSCGTIVNYILDEDDDKGRKERTTHWFDSANFPPQ